MQRRLKFLGRLAIPALLGVRDAEVGVGLRIRWVLLDQIRKSIDRFLQVAVLGIGNGKVQFQNLIGRRVFQDINGRRVSFFCDERFADSIQRGNRCRLSFQDRTELIDRCVQLLRVAQSHAQGQVDAWSPRF